LFPLFGTGVVAAANGREERRTSPRIDSGASSQFERNRTRAIVKRS
jgi:hypothetical protein